jgi:hypothetical protein
MDTNQNAATLVNRNQAQTTAFTAEQLGAMLNDRMAQRDARETYIRDKMGDLPESLRKRMPATGDQKQLYAAEQELRAEWQREWGILARTATDKGFLPSDLYSAEAIAAAQAAKGQPKNPDNMSFRELAATRLAGVAAPAPQAAPARADYSGMNALDLINLGLSQLPGYKGK